MDTRKIQKTGGSSFSVTLPKSWVNHHHLTEKSQLIYCQHPSGQLVFSPVSKNKELLIASLKLDYLTADQIEREIVSLYISGVDEIVLTAKNITPLHRNLTRSLIAKFIGFEFYESDSKYIKLKNISNSDLNLKDSLKRILSLVNSMYTDLKPAFKSHDKKLARDIVDRDIDIDRIHLYIKRAYRLHLKNLSLYQTNQLTLLDLSYCHLVGMRLERIADHLVKIADLLLVVNQPINQSVFKKYLDSPLTTNYFKILNSVVLNISRTDAHKLLDLSLKNQKDFLTPQIKNLNSADILIVDSVDRIHSYMANIAEEVLNFSIDKKDMRLLSLADNL